MFFKCFLSLSIAFSWHRIVDNERLLPVSNVALLIRQYIRRSSGSGAAAVQKSKQLLSNLIYRTWSIDQVLNFTWSNSKRILSRSNSPTFEYIYLCLVQHIYLKKSDVWMRVALTSHYATFQRQPLPLQMICRF